ncbi:phage tail assembly protein [Sphingomonas sp. ACRSK]|uniref:phage tail assembly protein n=1 Tax=Sphingomonas sp. ACRSK TaxID=2918213 RepID=UPI001EF6FFC6|nr:phage tail assembly protein [Sphingomonas sp. ACRSK]MCG7349282.1 phage tail assembly protein [Sphingomonas sp. ACRSK]
MTEQTAAPSAGAKFRKFKLDHEIVVAGEVLHAAGTEITVRKPGAGEMRGLTLMGLSQLDYNQLERLAPRITSPVLTKQVFGEMDPADLMQFGGEVMDFLLPTAAKEAVSPTE